MAKAATQTKKGTAPMNAPAVASVSTDTPIVPPAVVAAITPVAGITEKKQRSAPAQVAVFRTDVPIPTKSPRGVKSAYDFDGLPVGGSFGVLDKTRDKMASIVSAANRRYREPARDANGAIVYKTTEIKDAAGNLVGHAPTTEPASYVQTREFAVYDMNPADDPDKALSRVFRTK